MNISDMWFYIFYSLPLSETQVSTHHELMGVEAYVNNIFLLLVGNKIFYLFIHKLLLGKNMYIIIIIFSKWESQELSRKSLLRSGWLVNFIPNSRILPFHVVQQYSRVQIKNQIFGFSRSEVCVFITNVCS